MDERTRELIAIGASVGVHCQPCLAWHLDKARELGIDDETIRAAIEVGHMVDKGAMSAMPKFSAGNDDDRSGPRNCVLFRWQNRGRVLLRLAYPSPLENCP